MVMSMNSMGGYGSYGMGYGMANQNQSGNVPSSLKYKYGYDFDFYDKPKVAAARMDITPKAPFYKKPCSALAKFFGIE